MARGDYLGEFELVVLLGLARLKADAYGVSVYEEIDRVTGRDVTIPAVYVTLNRLEKKGFVSSRVIGDDEGAGRAKRFYRPTQRGMASLEASKAMLNALFRGVRFDTAASES
jgi:PadR family transcriptional regulator